MTTTRTDKVTAADGGTFTVTIVEPDGGDGPGILLLQEIFGVGDFIVSKARDLAELGYVVSCPDVFWRVQPDVALEHDEAGLNEAFGLMGRWSTEVTDETKASDLAAALDHLRSISAGKVAVMGYCLGGHLAYALACHNDVDACVSYYGSGIAGRLTEADGLACPTIFHFGGNDPYIPAEEVDAIRSALGGRTGVELHVHDGAGHAFENFLAPQFSDPAATERSWPLTVAFLERTLR